MVKRLPWEVLDPAMEYLNGLGHGRCFTREQFCEAMKEKGVPITSTHARTILIYIMTCFKVLQPPEGVFTCWRVYNSLEGTTVAEVYNMLRGHHGRAREGKYATL